MDDATRLVRLDRWLSIIIATLLICAGATAGTTTNTYDALGA
jgi:hypothetical protein